MKNQVYGGEHGIRDYLTPNCQNFTPLVELPANLNPYLRSHGVHIFVKLLNTLPLANVKSLPAWNMLQGITDPKGVSVVESSSGNTVFSMGMLAQYFGIESVKAIASGDVSEGKLDLLRIAGIDVELVDGPICPSPNDPKSSIIIAKKYAEKPGWINPGQYDNFANPDAHTAYTGPQIVQQLDGKIALFVAGLGTTGTLAGTAKYLLSQIPNVKITGLVRAPNNHVPGVRTATGLGEVAFDWRDYLTEKPITVNEFDSYLHGLSLIRAGLLVGPSTGFAYAGMLKQLDCLAAEGTLDTMRNTNVVFIAPDSMFPYVQEYFEVLGDSHFKAINDTRRNGGEAVREATSEIATVAELTVQDVFNDFKDIAGRPSTQHYHLIDIRNQHEFLDHHLPCSTNVPFMQLRQWLNTYDGNAPLVFICQRGTTSLRASKEAQQLGLDAFSMVGGTTEWSAQGYPRIRPQYC